MDEKILVYAILKSKEKYSEWLPFFEERRIKLVLLEKTLYSTELVDVIKSCTVCIIECHPTICKWEILLNFVKTNDVKVIVCSEKMNSNMIVEMLLSGVDDYLDINTPPQILAAKVYARIRRLKDSLLTTSSKKSVSTKDKSIILEKSRMICRIMDKRIQREIHLTEKEFLLLSIIVDKEDLIVSRQEILEKLYGNSSDQINSSVIDKYIQILRRKIGPFSKNIRTVYGSGYMYSAKNRRNNEDTRCR